MHLFLVQIIFPDRNVEQVLMSISRQPGELISDKGQMFSYLASLKKMITEYVVMGSVYLSRRKFRRLIKPPYVPI